jgi:site-specific recombinase XerD
MIQVVPFEPSNKGKKLPAEPLTRAEVDALLAACSATSATGLRNRALIVLLWRSQLRCDEALSLRPCDLDAHSGAVRVLHGKGDQARTVGLDPQAWAVVACWLAARAKLTPGPGYPINDQSPLLCTIQGKTRGGKWADSDVRRVMSDLGTKAGIGKRVHPHGLRHTGAVEMAEEGVDIRVISRQLGHGNVSTTHRYLDHLAPQAVLDAARARRW